MAFAFLGWGEWSPENRTAVSLEDTALFCHDNGGEAGESVYLGRLGADRRENWAEWEHGDVFMYRVGAEHSGRMLDGREHLALPEGL